MHFSGFIQRENTYSHTCTVVSIQSSYSYMACSYVCTHISHRIAHTYVLAIYIYVHVHKCAMHAIACMLALCAIHSSNSTIYRFASSLILLQLLVYIHDSIKFSVRSGSQIF